MIIQKWSAKIRPMQLRSFLETLKSLQDLYEKNNRVPWGRVHHRLYSGHEIMMERDFPSVAALDEDETRSQLPEIRELKTKLLDSIVPGTVLIELFETPN
jgi:hypothetical protein